MEFTYPEVAAGGFSRTDGTIEFYTRINALISPEHVMVDYGAGRGAALHDDTSPYRKSLQKLRGKCRKVIGIDVDEAVTENPGMDETWVIKPGDKIPLDDKSADVIVSDHTFEHIDSPNEVAAELSRILKSGGWLCARTPNRWGYIGMSTNLVPNRWHSAILKYAQPSRKEIDIFPTAYKLNTRSALKKHFPKSDFDIYVYGHFAEPRYFGNSKLLWAIMLFIFRITPECLAPKWMIFIRKK